MATSDVKSKKAGLIFGLALLFGAVASVVLVDWNPTPIAPPPLIRPVKTVEIKSAVELVAREFPGIVHANEEVDLTFEVPGRIIKLLYQMGDEITDEQLAKPQVIDSHGLVIEEAGDVVAILDPKDYQNEYNAAEAQRNKALSDVEKLTALVNEGAAKPRELADAQAALAVTEAQLAIKRKALDDTKLRAPFAGVIARRYVNNYENVQAKQQVVSLQDIASIEIEVSIPEQTMLLMNRLRGKFKPMAKFTGIDETFGLTKKEVALEADPTTNTYQARFVMPAPDPQKDPNAPTILPGMTAVIRATPIESEADDTLGYPVPTKAIGVHSDGGLYVWLVKPASGNQHVVSKQKIVAGELVSESERIVTSGVNKGDRVATAGVHLLTDGDRVRLYTPEHGGAKP